MPIVYTKLFERLKNEGYTTTAIHPFNGGMYKRNIALKYESFDKALLRRFDSCIDFNRYTKQDLHEIAEIILGFYLKKFKIEGRNIRLFNKILDKMEKIPYPGELKNLIKTSIAFSAPNEEFDYLRRLYATITNNEETDIKDLQQQGFTVREIEILSGISTRQVSRALQGVEK